MIPFDTEKKKVTAGAWFSDISLNYLPSAFSKYQRDGFDGYRCLERLKMDQKVIQVLLLLLLCPKMNSAGEPRTVEEGQPVKITCRLPSSGTIVFWFRVVDDSGMEFIGSFSPSATLKTKGPNYGKNLAVEKQSNDFVLTVKAFNRKSDSGVYTCAALVSGNQLSFGQVTQLRGPIIATTKPPVIQVSTTRQTTTPTSCHCNRKDKSGPSLFCAPIILGPLAGGCGLLLLLLIITILYCNKIRTRRCPHHYKRKPRMMAPEKQHSDRYI